MLTLNIAPESWVDDDTLKIMTFPGAVIQLEHSLVSLSRWEEIWKKPFLTKDTKSVEEIKSYIKCMCITQNVNPDVFDHLKPDQVKQIQDYIDDSHTATKFYNHGTGKYVKAGGEQMTAELLYYYMFKLQIPYECRKWNLNRLLTLIKIFSIKDDPKHKQKMPMKDIYSQNAKLNAARRAAANSKG